MEQKAKHVNKILKTIMSPDTEIWLTGFAGYVKIFRKYVRLFAFGDFFDKFILLCVFCNTLILALDGLYEDTSNLFPSLNLFFTISFAVDMILKIIGLGVKGYLRERMNLFDSFIVTLSIVELAFLTNQSNTGSFSAFRSFRLFRLLRTFRVLRVTRLLRSLDFMQVIIKSISK